MRGALLLAALLAVWLGGAAQAASSIAGNASEAEIKGAGPYQPLAASLGADTLAHAIVSDDKKQVTYEFLPRGELLSGWTRMVHVSVAQTADPEALNRTIDAMQKIVAAQGTIEFFDITADNKKRPAAQFCFTMNPGPNMEYSCGIIGEFAPGSVTVFQLQRLGAAIDDAGKAKLKEILPAYF